MKAFIYEVKILWSKDPYGEKAIKWLREQKMKPEKDWDIDMHGGQLDHTSFWFKEVSKAILMKLSCGGA